MKHRENYYNGLYLVGNYPDKDTFVKAAVKGLEFFDFLEVGIPFSDPVADGPVITEAAQKVIDDGLSVKELFATIKTIKHSVPAGKDIYIMTYANHIFSRGVDEFVNMCKDAGVKGLIIPDIPYIESAHYKQALQQQGLHFIHFITPENTDSQIENIARHAEGFLYAISMRGITGQNFTADDELRGKLSVASGESKAPVVLGFGIKNSESAANALTIADGFIMGTKMIELLNEGYTSYEKFIEELKTL
jgi:tryptophan synthase alpha chain